MIIKNQPSIVQKVDIAIQRINTTKPNSVDKFNVLNPRELRIILVSGFRILAFSAALLIRYRKSVDLWVKK